MTERCAICGDPLPTSFWANTAGRKSVSAWHWRNQTRGMAGPPIFWEPVCDRCDPHTYIDEADRNEAMTIAIKRALAFV